MKKCILFSFLTLNLFVFSSCGGDRSKNASQNSNASGVDAIDQSWLASATGKKWVAVDDNAPFSQMTFFTNGKMKDAVSEDDYHIDGNILVVKVIGLDIKYPLEKTTDYSFDLTVNNKNVFTYKLDNSGADNGANTNAPNSTTASTSSNATYAAGDKVQILWKGSWYPGTIKEVKDGGKYKIGYDGYDATWDETVGTDRLKK
ncbi:MAG TPA: tudor domain-containing protein [Bacteroidia bacterium]|nr:tudor domain-containing protein [Bacteroidia bacterium]